MAKSTKKSDLTFEPVLADYAKERQGCPYTALAGPNNAGKSLVLKSLKHAMGRTAYLVGTNRFYHVYHFNSAVKESNELDQLESNFNQHFHNEQYNYEQNALDLNKIIIGLSDAKRAVLFRICGDLIGVPFALRKVDEGNELSARYIDMDGQNIAVGSTGTRLLMTLLGICLDDRFAAVLIDEPELGLGPRLQNTFAEFLQDKSRRDEHFPHLKQVVVATHSHLFLDRRDMRNNYVTTKLGTAIRIARIASLSSFHQLQFNLLGNSLEAMFFPAAIVVVEGKTDHEYLDRMISLRQPGRRVTVIQSAGDVIKKVHGLKEAFGELTRSPIRNRLFVVVDSVHPKALRGDLERLGVLPDNVIAWAKNGIEFYYPPNILAEIFCCAGEALSGIAIEGDRVTLGQVTLTKNDLKSAVLGRLQNTSRGPAELEEGLMSRIAAAIE